MGSSLDRSRSPARSKDPILKAGFQDGEASKMTGKGRTNRISSDVWNFFIPDATSQNNIQPIEWCGLLGPSPEDPYLKLQHWR